MLFLLINSLFGYFSGNAVSINKLVFASGPIPGESVRSERENTIQFRMALGRRSEVIIFLKFKVDFFQMSFRIEFGGVRSWDRARWKAEEA